MGTLAVDADVVVSRRLGFYKAASVVDISSEEQEKEEQSQKIITIIMMGIPDE